MCISFRAVLDLTEGHWALMAWSLEEPMVALEEPTYDEDQRNWLGIGVIIGASIGVGLVVWGFALFYVVLMWWHAD